MVDLGCRTGRARRVLVQPGGKADARGAVAGVEDDPPFSELLVRGHLRRVQHGRDGRSGLREPLQRLIAREPRARRRDRGLTFVEAVDAFEASGAKRLLLTHRPSERPLDDSLDLAHDGLELEI